MGAADRMEGGLYGSDLGSGEEEFFQISKLGFENTAQALLGAAPEQGFADSGDVRLEIRDQQTGDVKCRSKK